MCKFLTGKSRLQQSDRKRVWRLLDNEVFKANDGTLYMAPRNMLSDNYTIPLWMAVIAGSPVDYDTRCSHIHDQVCYSHAALIINLTEKELRDKGYLRFSDKKNMWVCEDVPAEFLMSKEMGKMEANNLLYECMEAAGENWWSSFILRVGTIFNIGWIIDLLTHKVFELDLNRVYDEEYWRENVPIRR